MEKQGKARSNSAGRHRARLLGALIIAAAPMAKAGDLPANSIPAIRVSDEFKIDGKLDEKQWSELPAATAFKVVMPYLGANPTEATKIMVAYSDGYLFIGGHLTEKKGDIVSNVMAQAADINEDDHVLVLLDTFKNGKNGYWFAINPNGVRNEGLVENNDRIIPEWDGRWEGAAARTDDGWTFEMKIPFSTLSSASGDKVDWGINFVRYRAKGTEESRWTNISQNETRYSSANIGVLAGIESANKLKRWELRPSISAARTDDNKSKPQYDVKPSLDAIYNFDSASRAILTVNTDFSAVEVDDRIVSTDSYEEFFPEKRGFFLEDAGVFEFGGLNGSLGRISANAMPFNSRRIGLDPNGQVEDLKVGLKVSGRRDGVNYGMLGVQLDNKDGIGSKNVFVGRVSYEFDENNRLGAIGTKGDTTSNNENSLVGVDYNYRTSNVFDGNVLNVNAWMQKSNTEHVQGDDRAFGIMAELPNDKVYARLGVSEVQQNFNPGLGFLARAGVRQYSSDFAYKWRFADSYLNSIESSVYSTHYTDLDNRLLSSITYFNLVNVRNVAGDFVQFTVSENQDKISQGFPLLNTLFVNPGSYSDQRFWLTLSSAKHRKLSTKATYVVGKRYGGKYSHFETYFDLRKVGNTNFSAYFQKINMEAGGQAATAKLARVGTTTTFNGNLTWSNFLQYDNLSRSLGLNSRLHWELSPGKALYLVLNEESNREVGDAHYSKNKVVLKYSSYF